MKIAPKGSSERFLRDHLSYEGEECLLWPFKLRRSGYGLAVVDGVQMPASRWMCILAHGRPSHPNLQAAHSCGCAACVNPKHLRWASPKENSDDKAKHGTRIIGERNGKTSLTAEDIRAIRSAPPDLAALQLKYGVSKGCISKIRSRRRWAHVADDARAA
jgi:hypothetical protein